MTTCRTELAVFPVKTKNKIKWHKKILFRLELYRQEIQKLQHEKEQRTLLYERKLEDYENDRLLLRSMVDPELYQILEEYVEVVLI